MDYFLTLALMFVSVLLILVILLQRGRGGGLVGALSGLGGQSAFGTKAGDTFTRITIVIAAIWVMLAGISGQVLRSNTDKGRNFEKADLKTDIQASTKDGKSSAPFKNDDAGDEGGGGKGTTKPDTATDNKQDKDEEPARLSEEAAKKESNKPESPNADKDEKPETPSDTSKEPVKKEAEQNKEKSEKKEADGSESESK
ncbi:MAG: preprotein translocase subunit SecG [Planctomycetia bacterium]|nr:preprotein translocase subunit SecG [Planctomycetia bacterium]